MKRERENERNKLRWTRKLMWRRDEDFCSLFWYFQSISQGIFLEDSFSFPFHSPSLFGTWISFLQTLIPSGQSSPVGWGRRERRSNSHRYKSCQIVIREIKRERRKPSPLFLTWQCKFGMLGNLLSIEISIFTSNQGLQTRSTLPLSCCLLRFAIRGHVDR